VGFRSQVFLGIWILLALVMWPFYLFYKNAGLKQKLHPWLVMLVGALFLFFVGWTSGRWEVLLIAAPVTLVITVLNIAHIKFCKNCGKTCFGFVVKYCPNCGAGVDARGKPTTREG
jgi:urea transporter